MQRGRLLRGPGGWCGTVSQCAAVSAFWRLAAAAQHERREDAVAATQHERREDDDDDDQADEEHGFGFLG